MLMIQEPKCENYDLTTIRTSSESHLHWKDHLHKNSLYFRINGDYEADNEIDNSTIGKKTTNIYKQIPVLNGYHIISELDNNLKSRYYEFPLGYDNVDWDVNEVTKLESKMVFFFKNTKKDIVMTEDDEDFKNINNCRFCEKEIICDKVRDHCNLIGNYRGPADNTCKINVTQKHSNFLPSLFHNISNYDNHDFFKKLVDKNKDKVIVKIKSKTHEEYISVSYGCIRFIDSYRFLSGSLIN